MQDIKNIHHDLESTSLQESAEKANDIQEKLYAARMKQQEAADKVELMEKQVNEAVALLKDRMFELDKKVQEVQSAECEVGELRAILDNNDISTLSLRHFELSVHFTFINLCSTFSQVPNL